MSELVIVDVQPEYKEHISFSIPNFSDYVESSDFSSVHFLYNGKFTLGMIEESEYKMWLIRNGFSQELIRDAFFFDKGYAFFRDCMDPRSEIKDYLVRFIRFMWKNKIRDSRDIREEIWDSIDNPKVEELLKGTARNIYIPELMDYLVRDVGNNPEVVGGGVDECLKEVIIAMQALNMSYTVNEQWTYP